MDLKGTTVLVTGAAKRIGRVIALTLAERGANIIVHHLSSTDEAHDVCREIEQMGCQAMPLQADLGRVEDIQHMHDEVYKVYSKVPVLINNASIYEETPLPTVTEEDWDRHLDINLKGQFFCAQKFGLSMRQQGGGKIINIADWAGLRPYLNYTPYLVSKAGLIAMSKAMALELAPSVTSHAVALGPILFPDHCPENQRQEIIQKTPLQREGSPESVAKTVRFIIEEADYTTGSIFYVDGGRHL